MMEFSIRRPTLTRGSRYRWDAVRGEHQLVFPEGLLVLNESGAAIVRHCDGRSLDELIASVADQFEKVDVAQEVRTFLSRLYDKGLVRDAEGA